MKKTEKISYEVDPHNRLVFTRKDYGPSKFRRVLDGEFKIDKNNALTYHIKEPQDLDIPQQVKLQGRWSLNKNHNLVITLDRWSEKPRSDKLSLEGQVLDVRDNELAFALTTKNQDNSTHTYIIKLNGRWQADGINQLSFLVSKEDGSPDKLTLKGAWQVNRQNEISYTYIKSYLLKRERIVKILTFKGYWNITKKLCLSYILNKTIGSQFDFTASLGRPGVRSLEYELGIGADPFEKKITLFGSWKVNKGFGLLFEMPYERGRISQIVFGAVCRLNGFYVDFKLKNRLGRDLGMDLRLSRNILGDQGQVYLEALKSDKDVTITAGAGFRW